MASLSLAVNYRRTSKERGPDRKPSGVRYVNIHPEDHC